MTLYLSGTVVYSIVLLLYRFNDRECPKTDLISWIVIAIASSLWVIVVPISLIEIIGKSKERAEQSDRIEAKAFEDNTSYLEKPVSVS